MFVRGARVVISGSTAGYPIGKKATGLYCGIYNHTAVSCICLYYIKCIVLIYLAYFDYSICYKYGVFLIYKFADVP